MFLAKSAEIPEELPNASLRKIRKMEENKKKQKRPPKQQQQKNKNEQKTLPWNRVLIHFSNGCFDFRLQCRGSGFDIRLDTWAIFFGITHCAIVHLVIFSIKWN